MHRTVQLTCSDSSELCLKLIGIEKVAGGLVRASQLVLGVALIYAGFEQQPKALAAPKFLYQSWRRSWRRTPA